MTEVQVFKPLQAPSILLMGAAGAGKSSSIATLIKAGIEVFAIMTEPNGADSVIDALKRLNLPIEKFHWRSITPVPAGWKSLRTMATSIKMLTYEALSGIKSGIEKPAMNQIEELLNHVENFVDERTGQSYGDVTTWDDTRAFAVDSLSGINLMSWLMTVGYKPAAHQGEWGVAMNFEEQLILKMTSDCYCYFLLTAHIDRESDEITGGSRIMAAALGRKLAPKISRFFSEVILARRGGGSTPFTWSTADANADLKNRALPVGDNLQPDFAPIVAAHNRRKKEIAAERERLAALPSPA